MATIQGTLKPLKDKILVTDMNFEEEVTVGGIVLPSDDGKGQGVKPRWGRVWAVGPEQTDIKIGDWILVEHGRWTREMNYRENEGTVIKIHMVDNDAILLTADERPTDIQRNVAVGAGSNVNFNVPGI